MIMSSIRELYESLMDWLQEARDLTKGALSEFMQIRTMTSDDFFGMLPLVASLAFLLKALHRPQMTTVSDGLIVAAALTNFLSNLTLTTSASKGSWVLGSMYNLFFILTVAYVQTNSLVTFFILYELFLLPSTALMMIFSPGKRGLETSKSFLIWTQTGSVMVFVGIWYLMSSEGMHAFTDFNLWPGRVPLQVQLLVLFGFLMKMPSFPFYFWLLKTHVESMTSFSMFLSGFLVKIAVFGLWRFYPMFSYTTKCVAMCLLLSGGMAASAAFFKQADYKRLVAYSTVQEMAQMTSLIFLLGPNNGALVGQFIVVHSLLSAVFFYLSDMLYKLYGSRSVYSLNNLMLVSPKLAVLTVVGILLFKGLPFTTKNKVEFGLLDLLLGVNYSLLGLWLVAVIFMGNMGITYANFKLMSFGSNNSTDQGEVTHFEGLYLLLTLATLILILQVST